MAADPASKLREFVEGNTETRKQLEDLVAGLSISQLSLQMEDSDWTISAALAHLAFWDRCIIVKLDEWEREQKEPRWMGGDEANFAALPQWLALPGPIAAKQAAEAARLLDARIEQVPAWLVEAVAETDWRYLIRRAGHRREHLDQIELTLRNCGC